MATATEQQQASETPQTQEPQGFSMEQFFGEKNGGKPAPNPKQDVTPPVADAPGSQEKKPNESTVSVTPPGTEEEQPEKSETSEEKPISKHEREKYKLREKARKLEEALERERKEKADLKAKYGEEPEQKAPEMDEATRIRIQERMNVSQERFVELHGKDILDQKIMGEDAPWKEIEEKAREKDPHAMALVNRAFSSKDPYSEAYRILEEEELFEHYGTRSISQIIEKALAEKEETITQQVMAKLTPTNRHETGKAPKTLGGVLGSSPATGTPAPEDFKLSSYFAKRGT